MKTGIELIAEERQRQIEAEGWTPQNDHQYTNRQLVRAAVCYCESDNMEFTTNDDGENLIESGYWPFDITWWKPTPDNRIRELQKAGALIAAEIDRLQRLQACR